MRLLDLDPQVQTWVVQDLLSVGHAKVLLGLKAHDEQRLLAEKILRQSSTVRTTERMVARQLGKLGGTRRRKHAEDRQLSRVEGSRESPATTPRDPCHDSSWRETRPDRDRILWERRSPARHRSAWSAARCLTKNGASTLSRSGAIALPAHYRAWFSARLIRRFCRPRRPEARYRWEEFSGQRALGHVQALVGLGPRPPESEAIKKARAYIRQNWRRTGWQVIDQPFTDQTPRGTVQFVNLIARRPDQPQNAETFLRWLRITTRKPSIRSDSSARMTAARAPAR